MRKGTSADCASVVVATKSVEGILVLRAAIFGGGVHLHRGVIVAHASVVNVLTVVLGTAIGALVDPLKQTFASTSLLLLLLWDRWLTVEHLCHHLTLHLHHL